MKTLICVKGEWYWVGLLDMPIRDGIRYLTQCGTDTFIAGVYEGEARCRHPLTPVDPSAKHVVAMKVGLGLYGGLGLEKYQGHPMEIMKKSDRPMGTEFIDLETGRVYAGAGCDSSGMLCIALGPKEEPEEPEKTTEDCLRDLLSAVDKTILTSEVVDVAAVAKAHLQKTNDQGA